MKKKPELEDDGDRHLQILKAVARAWQTRAGGSKPPSEVAAHRRSCRGTPSRFKIEAMRSRWEVVAVCKRLERGLVLDGDDGGGRFHRRRRRERCNGFRNLFD